MNKAWQTPELEFDPLGGPYSDYQLQFLTDLDVAKKEIKKLYKLSRRMVEEYEPYQRYLRHVASNMRDFDSAQAHSPDGREANHFISVLCPRQISVEEADAILEKELRKVNNDKA